MKHPRKTIFCHQCGKKMEELPEQRDHRNKIHRYRCLNVSCGNEAWVNR